MRNLKKVLSLVLALMMVLSVMVTASAADFADADSIQHTEAVEVLSGLGVISGVKNTDGTYSYLPNETLNREAAAKIVAYMVLGGDVPAATVDALNNPFTDVNGWSEAVIKWCYSQGIVSGVDANTFLPKDYLTGYAFAKMLLVAIGVDGEYTGSNWKLNVYTAAKANNLLVGLEDIVLSANLTREHAAQMAFNALLQPTETSVGYAVYGKDDVVLGYYPTILEAATVANAVNGSYSIEATTYGSGALAEDYNLKTASVWAGIGYNGYYWYVDGNESGTHDSANYDVVVSNVVYTDTIVGTYTTADSWKTVSADLGLTKNYTVNNYVNGVAAGTETIPYNSTAKVSNDTSVTLTVVVTAGKEINCLYTVEHLADATRGDKVTDKESDYYGQYPWTFADQDGNVLTAVYGGAKAYSTTAKYLVVNTYIPTITEAGTAAGYVTGTANSYIRLNGEKMNKANTGVAASVSTTTPVTVYLNSAGDVMLVGAYVGTSTTTEVEYAGYAYVTAVEYYATAYVPGTLVGASQAASIVAKATVITAAGEKLTVDLATAVEYNESTYGYDVSYYLDGWQEITFAGTTAYGADEDLGWFAYYEDGGYCLDALETSAVVANAKAATIGIDGRNYYMTSGTKVTFVNLNEDTGKIETSSVTGYANITATVAAALTGSKYAVYEATTTNVLTSITVYGISNVQGASYEYAIFGGYIESGVYGDYYSFVIDGEAVPMLVTADVSGLTVGDIINYETNPNGVVTTVAAAANVTKDITIAAISEDGTYFIDENGAVVMLGSYVVYDSTDSYAEVELAAGQIVNVVVEDVYGTEYVVMVVVVDYVEE